MIQMLGADGPCIRCPVARVTNVFRSLLDEQSNATREVSGDEGLVTDIADARWPGACLQIQLECLPWLDLAHSLLMGLETYCTFLTLGLLSRLHDRFFSSHDTTD